MSDTKKLSFTVRASRIDAHGSQARCKDARITLDTDLAGRPDAFNPAELLLAALAACIIKGIERVKLSTKVNVEQLGRPGSEERRFASPDIYFARKQSKCRTWRRRAVNSGISGGQHFRNVHASASIS